MKSTELTTLGPTTGAAAPKVKPSSETVALASGGNRPSKTIQVKDQVTLGPKPNPAPQEVKLAQREVEADYRILKAIINRQIKSGDYPPLETVDKLAKMMTAGTGR